MAQINGNVIVTGNEFDEKSIKQEDLSQIVDILSNQTQNSLPKNFDQMMNDVIEMEQKGLKQQEKIVKERNNNEDNFDQLKQMLNDVQEVEEKDYKKIQQEENLKQIKEKLENGVPLSKLSVSELKDLAISQGLNSNDVEKLDKNGIITIVRMLDDTIKTDNEIRRMKGLEEKQYPEDLDNIAKINIGENEIVRNTLNEKQMAYQGRKNMVENNLENHAEVNFDNVEEKIRKLNDSKISPEEAQINSITYKF